MIRQLTGTIEQLQYRNQQLEAQIRAMGGTRRRAGAQPQPRAGAAVQQPAPASQMGQPLPPAQQARPPAQAGAAPMTPPASVPGAAVRRVRPVANPNAPGAPRTLGTLSSSGAVTREPPPIITAEPPVGAPGGRGAGAPLDLSTLATGAARGDAGDPGQVQQQGGGMLPPPPSRNLSATGAVAAVAPPAEQPKDYYDLGYGYVLRKDYALAEQTFDAFLKKFPNDRRAADAQFWLGESLFQRQRYDAGGAVLPRHVDQARSHAQGAGRAAAARPVAGGAQAEGNGLRHASPRSGRKYPQALHQREAGRRARTEACPAADDSAVSAAERPAAVRSISSDYPALILAVSGGPDSTALMLLAARWRKTRKRGPKLIAVTSTTACARRRSGRRWRSRSSRARSASSTARCAGPAASRRPACRRPRGCARYRLLAEAVAQGQGAPMC